jgi:two-component system, cell cycle sensor histidine kinase and response regulator CckA
MAQALELEELTPASTTSSALEAAERRIRELSEQVEVLQYEVATLRVRHLRAGEHDAGLGSLLTEREASFDEVERLANVGSWIWDVRTNEVVWSEQCFRIFGYDPTHDRATQAAFFEALHPDDRELLMNHSSRTASTGITAPAPLCRFIHKDGSTRYVMLSGTPIRDQAGQLIRIVGAALDVTGFVTVETALRHKAQLLDEAERIAGLGSWVWSSASDSIEWSETMYRIFGIEPGTKVTNELFFERVHPDDRSYVRNSERCFGEGRAKPVDFRVLWPDGTLRHVCMEATIERDPQGKLTRLVGTVQDITARTQLEQQLRHSQKMDAIGTFAGGIAHDFNNYLMVIQGNVQLINARSSLQPAQQGMLAEIATAASSCTALTRQLLSLARRQVSAPRVLDVATLVSRSAPLLRRLLGDHIELVLASRGGGTVVRADPVQLEQVLVNLAVNARDAMPDGGVVTIETTRVQIDLELADSHPALELGEHVRLSVRDIGAGIPQAIHARVFEPFFTTKGHGKGTGLGLSTVYGIVQQWHGHVEFDSQLGQGTVFHVWLPAHDGPAEYSRESERPVPATGHETVLLAEDEPQVRQLIRTVLEQAGYVVLVAEDGEQALRQGRRASRVDLLVSDVRMPHLGGVQLARQLRETWPEIKVLLMSGYPDIDAVTAHEHGIGDDLFAKPFGTSELLDRVRRALDRPHDDG